MKDKIKNILFVVVIIAIIGIAVGIIFLMLKLKEEKVEEAAINKKGSRTIMIYMVGSSAETDYGFATKELEEMVAAKPDLKNTNVLVYTGGTRKWQNGFKNQTVYALTKDGFVDVKTLSNQSSGSPQALTAFLDYAKSQYDTDLYDLIFWDHGGGPIFGFGYDELYEGDKLTLNEMVSGLESSKFNKDNRLELIAFDASLMGNIETIYALKDFAHYFIASPSVMPGTGLDYSFLSSIGKDTRTEDLGKSIIDSYYDYYDNLARKNASYYFDLSLSMLNLHDVEKIVESLDPFIESVEKDVGTWSKYSAIVNAATKTESYGYADEESYDLIDLYGFANNLSSSYDKANGVMEAINNATTYSKTNLSDSHGVGIYFPYYAKDNLSAYKQAYNQLSFSKAYQKFINNYSSRLMSDIDKDWNFILDTPEIIDNIVEKEVDGEVVEEIESTIQVQLDESLVDYYNQASYVIYKKIDSGYVPVYRNANVSISKKGLLSADFYRKETVVKNKDGELGYADLIELGRDEDRIIYSIPMTLSKYKTGVELLPMSIHFEVSDGHPKGMVLGYSPVATVEDTRSLRQYINIKQWDSLQFKNVVYSIEDDKELNKRRNKKLPKVKAVDAISENMYEVMVGESYSIQIMDFDPKDGEYYVSFEIIDTHGNHYFTNVIDLK